MENNKLVRYESRLVEKVANAINLTAKLMAPKEPQLIPYRRGNMWGFYSPDKKEIIYCRYSRTSPFINGYASVQRVWKYGMIDMQGKLVIPCIYTRRIEPFSEGLTNVRNSDKWGFVDTNAEVAIPFIYDNAAPFCEGLARVRKNKKYGFINKANEVVADFIYDNVYSFLNGFAEVRIGEKWGAINREGELIHPISFDSTEELDSVTKRNSDLIRTKEVENKYMLVDNNDSPLSNILFDSVVSDWGDFKDGLIGVEINGKYGFINKSGILIIPCIYDDVDSFTNGLCGVRINNQWGYIDKLGNLVIECKYFRAYPFEENGLALVDIDSDTEGYIDRNGVEYWED